MVGSYCWVCWIGRRVNGRSVHDACHIIHIPDRHELNASIVHWQQLINLLLGSWTACILSVIINPFVHLHFMCGIVLPLEDGGTTLIVALMLWAILYTHC